MSALSVSTTLEGGWRVKPCRSVSRPLNAKQVDNIKSGQELIDGAVPGLRVSLTAAGLSWGLSVRVKAKRRWIAVGVGIGLAEARRRAARLRQDIADGRDPAAERQETWTRAKNASEGLGTLESALRLYFDHRPELRSARTQAKALMPVFRDYLPAPALDFTPALAQLAIDKWARERSADARRKSRDLLQAVRSLGGPARTHATRVLRA